MTGLVTKESLKEAWVKNPKGKLTLPEGGDNQPIVDKYGYLILTKKSAHKALDEFITHGRFSASLSFPNSTAFTIHVMSKNFGLICTAGKHLDFARTKDDGPSSSGGEIVVSIERIGSFGFRKDATLYPSYIQEKLGIPKGDAVYLAPWLTEFLAFKRVEVTDSGSPGFDRYEGSDRNGYSSVLQAVTAKKKTYTAQNTSPKVVAKGAVRIIQDPVSMRQKVVIKLGNKSAFATIKKNLKKLKKFIKL